MVLTQPHLLHLPLRHSTAVINDSCGLEAGGLVELNEQLPHHVGQILNDLLAEELLLQRNIYSTVNNTGPSPEGIMSERLSGHIEARLPGTCLASMSEPELWRSSDWGDRPCCPLQLQWRASCHHQLEGE